MKSVRSSALAFLGATTLLAGCASQTVTTSDGRPMPPKPRAVEPPPPGSPVERMMLVVGQNVQDTDGNGYPDTLMASVGLFTEPATVAIPADGSFVFTLYRQGEANLRDVRPVAQWRFDAETAATRVARKPWGTGYDFELNLLAQGGDRMKSTACDLRGTFVRADGTSVQSSNEVRPVRVGR